MTNIYRNITLSRAADGDRVEYTGFLSFHTDSFEFSSDEYKLEVIAENIEYIMYENPIFILVHRDPAEYSILVPEDTLQTVQTEINTLFERWIHNHKSVDQIETIYDRGLPSDLIVPWLVRVEAMKYLRKLSKDKTQESTDKAKTILTVLSKIEDRRVISELLTGIKTISDIFSIEYKETSEIEKYVNDPEIKRNNDLHWLKKYFYGLQMGNIKVSSLEEMIDESLKTIISQILPTITGKMEESEIRKVFEEVHDPTTLDIFIREIEDKNLFQKIEQIETPDRVYILYHITEHNKNVFFRYATENPRIIETIANRFLNAIDKKDHNLIIPLQSIVENLLSAKNIQLIISISECIPLIFEYPGTKTTRIINNWAQISSNHRLSLYHLQILHYTTKTLPVYIRLYITTSGIILSVITKIVSGTETEKFLASAIVLDILTTEDRIVQKYVKTVRLSEILRDTLACTEHSARHTAYSPNISKILQIIDK